MDMPADYEPKKLLFHYYGDIVRRLFILAGAIMLISLPFVKDLIPVSIFFAVLGIDVVVVVAGLMSPGHRWTALVNVVLSVIALPIFEYYAVTRPQPLSDLLFWINQSLAAVFLFALYFSVKTFRGFFIKGDRD